MARTRRLRLLLALAAVVPLAGAGLVFVARAHVVRGAAGLVYQSAADVPGREVAIVPGARVWDRDPSPILEERLRGALALYRAGKVRKILVSGDHGRRGYDEVNAMRIWLERAGVAPADVFLDHAGFRTLDTMERAARVFGVGGAVICTQAFHQPRSVFLARRAGIDVVGLVAVEPAWSHARYNAFRETLAQAGAVVDSYLLRRGPRFLGPRIPISGDGRATWDEKR